MSFLCEEHRPNSPYIEALWRIRQASDGAYFSAADGQWDLAFINEDNSTRILLTGPSSHAQRVTYRAGNRNFGIRFRRGIIFPGLNAHAMLNTTLQLQHDSKYFWLNSQQHPIPRFEDLPAFVERLARRGIISQDTIVAGILAGKYNELSSRTAQRHFLQATGLSHTYIKQIDRARQAITLLQAGKPIADVANETGYADQAHMNRLLKHLTHKTPGQILGKLSFPFNPYNDITGLIRVQ